MNTARLTLGGFEIHGLRDGYFHLDGGTMFGVVPKVLWEKNFPSDEKNRIRLGLNSLLIKTEKKLIVVETGIGPKLDLKSSEIYGVETKPGLLASLESLGFSASEVDFVINTHLHFDHCGGNTVINEEGKAVPAFPSARYIIQKGEWEHALHPNERDMKSYLSENFIPLEEHKVLDLVEGDTEITDGVEVVVVPGHTAHHQCVRVWSQGKTLFFLGDLVPTSAHAGLSYIMSYDLFPLETLENKKKYFQQGLEEGWLFAFCHDPEFYFACLSKEKEKYTFKSV
ncbi:MAG: MBL fold metallo-hydrolase [Candidatus Aminicenantales bacterium]